MTEIERLAATVEALTEENDDLHEAVDRLTEEAKNLLCERQEARRCAEELREMLMGLDEVTAALPLPWEVENGDNV